MQASPLGRRLSHGLFWSVFGMAASRGSALLASVFVARLLGQERFGEWNMIQGTCGMLALFAGFGMGVTATKFVAEFRLTDPARAGRIIALSNVFAVISGLIFTAVLWAAAGVMATRWLHEPDLTPTMQIGALLPVLSAITGAQGGALVGLEAFRSQARLQVFTGLGTLLALVVGAWLGGVNGATWGLVGVTAVTMGITQWALRQACDSAGITVSYREWRREFAVVWRFSLPAVQAWALVAPVNWYCSTVLLAKLPDGDAQVGIFNAANQWFLTLQAIPTLLGQSLLPVLSERLAAAHGEGVKLFKTALKLSTLTALPVFLLALVSPWIMRAYGKEFAAEWPTLVLSVIAAGLLAVQAPVGQTIIASGNIWPGLWMNVGWAVLFIAGSLFLSRWGALGVAGARLAAYVIHGLWTFWFAFRVIRHNRPLHAS